MTFDRELFKKTFHSFHEVSPWLFPALAAENFLLAVRPFVVLHFSATVVDGLYRGEGEARVLLQALWLSCGVLVVGQRPAMSLAVMWKKRSSGF